MISSIITAIVIGAVIGALGRLVVSGKQDISILVTIAIGIVAALLGTLIAGLVGVSDTPGIDWIELLIQVLLAAVGVAIVAGRGLKVR
ncbi:MAG: GlsB/YeaQ/YmgE family stress response membrane protein [Phycicoccus sp.]